MNLKFSKSKHEDKTYWVGWESAEEGNGEIDCWITGQYANVLTYCAVIEAKNDEEVVRLVRATYPDAGMRFCDEKKSGHKPSFDRFPT